MGNLKHTESSKKALLSFKDKLAIVQHASTLGLLVYLKNRYRSIIIKRYLSESYRSLEELGREFGISKERVRQLEVKAIKRLQYYIRRYTTNSLPPLKNTPEKNDNQVVLAKPLNTGFIWSEEEEQQLKREFLENVPLSEIASSHKRSIKGIHARLVKLKLIAPGE